MGNENIKTEIDFINLSQAENVLANQSLRDLQEYLETIQEDDRFERFLALFNQLCQERKLL